MPRNEAHAGKKRANDMEQGRASKKQDLLAAVRQASTEFTAAIILGNEKQVMAFLKRGPDFLNIRLQTKYGDTPLTLAVRMCKLLLLKMMLESKCDPNRATETGQTPLYWAIEAEQPSLLSCLLEYGADVNVDSCTDIPLHKCIQTDNFDAFELLLKAGADVEARDDFQRPALALAAELLNGSRFVSVLLAANADVDSVDEDNETALFHACETPDNIASVRLLLEAKTNPNHQNEEGMSPLLFIIKEAADMYMEPPFAMVKLLLWHGADQNQLCTLSDGDWSAMYLAQREGFIGLYATMRLYDSALTLFAKATVLRRTQDMITHARVILHTGAACFLDRLEASACRAAGEALVLECLNKVQKEHFLGVIGSMKRPIEFGKGVTELILGYMTRTWEPSLWRRF